MDCAPKIKQVSWYAPLCTWVKGNTDGVARGCPGQAACGNSLAAAMGSFAGNLGSSTSFHAELVGAMMAIENAYSKDWFKLWLECDSSLVVLAFNSSNEVP